MLDDAGHPRITTHECWGAHDAAPPFSACIISPRYQEARRGHGAPAWPSLAKLGQARGAPSAELIPGAQRALAVVAFTYMTRTPHRAVQSYIGCALFFYSTLLSSELDMLEALCPAIWRGHTLELRHQAWQRLPNHSCA